MEETTGRDSVDVDNTQDPDDEEDDGNDYQKIPCNDFDSVAHVLQ